MNLKNKKVIITGATGGIGYSLVRKFNSYGSIVLATGTNEEKLNKLKQEFNNIKPIERHRIAMNILKEEFNNGLHAVSFDLKDSKD